MLWCCVHVQAACVMCIVLLLACALPRGSQPLCASRLRVHVCVGVHASAPLQCFLALLLVRGGGFYLNPPECVCMSVCIGPWHC
jgi:hypothetical protein